MRLKGRAIVGGKSEGIALASDRPLSFLGGVDPETGIVRDPDSPLAGESLAGRVLVLPYAKGSTVGSYVLYGLRTRDKAPAAILVARAETILAVGAVISNVPLLDGIPVEVLRTGDEVSVDADAGSVELAGVTERHAVTAFLEREGRVLALRRADRMPSFPGKWSGVSGILEGDEDPEERARKEVEEETGLRDLTLVARGGIVHARHGDDVYTIRPLRFTAKTGEVRLNPENVEYRWVLPEELETLDAVPRLAAAYAATKRP